ncbi:MAG: insulinase family protein [Thermodesulfobacteriota bacterium]|nr:insulinase family protein [Thermodesulfobacteriota bacterium]
MKPQPHKKQGLFVLVCLMGMLAMAAGCVPALLDFGAAKGPLPESDLSPDPAMTTGTLENGIDYVLLENNRPEDRVHMHLMVDAGSYHEAEDQRGLAHYLEHMLFCGTEHFPPGELIKYFQRIGMRFGNDVNASTGFFRTVYDLHLPSGDAERLEEGLVVMKDYAEGALLLPEEVERERGVIMAEKRTRDSAAYRTFKKSLRFELDRTRVARRFPIGTESVIRAADRNALKAFYDAWYRPENMTLVAVGNFDTPTLQSLIKDALSGVVPRADARPVPPPGIVSHEGEKVFYHHEQEAGNTEVSIETIRQRPDPPDSKAYKTERFIRDMAFRILNYRLEALAAGDNPLFTSASANSGRVFRYFDYAAVSADCSPENWERALGVIEKETRRVFEHGFTAGEVDRVRKEALAEMDRAVQQAATRESGRLARQIMRDLARERVFQSPEQERDLLAPVAERMTPSMLLDAFTEAWGPAPSGKNTPSNRLVLVTGNADLDSDSRSPETRIRNIYESSQKEPVAKPEEKAAVSFPYLPEPETAKAIAADKQVKDLGIRQVDFKNGVRLNIKQTDFKDDSVIAKVVFGAGESTEPSDKPALAELAAAVINESGFRQMKKETLRRALAGKTADMTFSVEEDSFSLNGSCTPTDLRLMFQLIYAFYKDFGCSSEAYQRSLERFAQKYDKLAHTIDGAMATKGRRFLAGGDSRFGLPVAYEAFTAQSVADIRQWIGAALAQGPPEISVVGDIASDAVVAAAATYFGSMAFPETAGRENHRSANRRGPDFPEGGNLVLTVPTKIKKARAEVAWPTDDYWNIHQTRRFFVLADVVSERMRKQIREASGQSYSQFAYNHASKAYPGYGVFHAVVESAPEETRTVIGQIREIAADIVENGVSEEELRRALDPTMTHIKDVVETNEYWLNSVLAGSRAHPERLDWSRSFLEDYQSITADEIAALARTYLDNSDSTSVVIKPESGNNDED